MWVESKRIARNRVGEWKEEGRKQDTVVVVVVVGERVVGKREGESGASVLCSTDSGEICGWVERYGNTSSEESA